MEREQLTLGALSEMNSSSQTGGYAQTTGGEKGTRENPYLQEEIDPLIDNGTFGGGYVKDENGFITYWLGCVNIYGNSNSSSDSDDEDNMHDFNSDWYDDIFGGSMDASSNFWSNSDSMSGYNASSASEFATGFAGTVGNSIEANAGMTRVGNNGKLYFETRTGRVFRGNKYVGTTSLKQLGNTIGRYYGRANIAITVFNVATATYNAGKEAGLEEAIEVGLDESAIAAGGIAGGWIGLKIGSAIGSAICPGPGTAAGLIVGTVLGIIGGVGGSITGSYFVELGVQ